MLLSICAMHRTMVKGSLHTQVVFPLVLDLYEFCTEDYKQALEGPRKAWQESEDKKAGLERAAKAAAKSATKDEKAPKVSCPHAEVNHSWCFRPHMALNEQFGTSRAHVLPKTLCARTVSEELRHHAQANGTAKAEEAKATGEANGSAADVDMKDAAGPSEGASGDSDLHKGQLTGKDPPNYSPTAATKPTV